MKLPKKVKILGFDYKVRLHDTDDKEQNGAVLGYCDFYRSRITVNSDMSEQQQVATFIHEILEAVNHHTELSLEHNKIKTLETAIYQVLNDNGFFKEK
jgi:hypothetical protein